MALLKKIPLNNLKLLAGERVKWAMKGCRETLKGNHAPKRTKANKKELS